MDSDQQVVNKKVSLPLSVAGDLGMLFDEPIFNTSTVGGPARIACAQSRGRSISAGLWFSLQEILGF